jgi:hypothetical protein
MAFFELDEGKKERGVSSPPRKPLSQEFGERKIIETSDWWLKAVFGEEPALHESTPPQPGYYRTRLIQRGIVVPARIWIIEERDENGELVCDQKFGCEIAGKQADAFENWMYLAGHPIWLDEYLRLTENNGIAWLQWRNADERVRKGSGESPDGNWHRVQVEY